MRGLNGSAQRRKHDVNLLLQKDTSPYFLRARFTVGAQGSPGRILSKSIGEIPGSELVEGEWGDKYWLVPKECREIVAKRGRALGFETPAAPPPLPPPNLSLFNQLGKFEVFQKPDIERVTDLLQREGGALVAYAMGLGKTPVAIEIARQLQRVFGQQEIAKGCTHPRPDNCGEWWSCAHCIPPNQDILIIAPAMAREVWLHGNGPDFKDNGFARWWPDRYVRFTHRGREYCSEPFAITDSSGGGPRSLSRWIASTAAAGGSGGGGRAVVVSYGMLRGLLEAVEAGVQNYCPALIVVDEAHYISNRRAKQTQAVYEARDLWPDAKRLALTGTPLANPSAADGLHSILDWLYPDRFGTLKRFRWRYMNHEEAFDNKEQFRGFKYDGFNKEHQEELRSRLASVSVRLTKADVAHLLPPFRASLVPFDGDRRSRACEFALSLLQQGHNHVRVSCFLHESVDSLVAELERQQSKEKNPTPVYAVDGRQDPLARANTLAAARSQERSITVATIDSTKVAIDLTFQTASVYAELTHKIEAVLQSIGRGHRASSVAGHDLFILADETGDELAHSLCRKANTLAEIVGAGTEETALIATLGSLKERGVSQSEIDEMLSFIKLGEDF